MHNAEHFKPKHRIKKWKYYTNYFYSKTSGYLNITVWILFRTLFPTGTDIFNPFLQLQEISYRRAAGVGG